MSDSKTALATAVHALWETEPTVGCYHRPDDGSGLCEDHAAELLYRLPDDAAMFTVDELAQALRRVDGPDLDLDGKPSDDMTNGEFAAAIIEARRAAK
jgi:hypothetical protein